MIMCHPCVLSYKSEVVAVIVMEDRRMKIGELCNSLLVPLLVIPNACIDNPFRFYAISLKKQLWSFKMIILIKQSGSE